MAETIVVLDSHSKPSVVQNSSDYPRVTQKVRSISTSKATFRIVKIKNGIVYRTRGGCLNVISADRAHPNFCGSNLWLTPDRPSLPTYRSSHIVFKSNISYQKKVPVEALDLLETHTNERAHHSLAYVRTLIPFRADPTFSWRGVTFYITIFNIFCIVYSNLYHKNIYYIFYIKIWFSSHYLCFEINWLLSNRTFDLKYYIIER